MNAHEIYPIQPVSEQYDLLLVNVPSTFEQGPVLDGEAAPHGLLRVATAAEQDSIRTGLLDAHRLHMSSDGIASAIETAKPGVVGLNPTSVNVTEARAVADICSDNGIPFILGGVHATLSPTEAHRDFPAAAAIVRGAGEAVIGRLVNDVLGGNTSETPGVYLPHSDHRKLARTPLVDYSGMPFVRQDRWIARPLYEHTLTIRGVERHLSQANLFVTYGCPFACAFCSSPVLVGRGEKSGQPPYVRPRDERIADEVAYAVRDLGANALHFLDDMAFATAKHVAAFHEGMEERGLLGSFVWKGMTRTNTVNRFNADDLGRLVETGAWKIALGVESGSDEILQRMGKRARAADAITAVKKLAEAGIESKGFFMFGFPGETVEQMQQTADLITQLGQCGMTEVAAFQFKPYPGTAAYTHIKQANPEALARLGYPRSHYANPLEKNKGDILAANSPWLPDDLTIAEVPSGNVREIVQRSLQEFYDSRASN